MDAVLLSGFAHVKRGEKVLDMGTGTGIIPLLLSAKTQGEHFTALEIQKEIAEMYQCSKETISKIYHSYQNPFIIAVDASLGIPEHIGYATLSTSPLIPGKGVNKKLPAIGNLSITGIVNVAGFPNSVLLQSTRLHTVMTLANCIRNALYWYFLDIRMSSRTGLPK